MKQFMLIVLIISCFACNKTNRSEVTCMEDVMEQDSILGEIRNHSSEQISLSETISNYVSGINQLKFNKCPKDFEEAFHEHAQAWSDMKKVTNNYPELRGELHDLFDKLEKSKDAESFKNHLENIWSTWRVIEAVMEE